MAAVPDLDLTRIRNYCEQRVPVQYRDEARVEARVRGESVTIFDRRPPWHPNLTQWSRVPVAQLRYDPGRQALDSLLGRPQRPWQPYDMIDPGGINELLKEIHSDPTCISWG